MTTTASPVPGRGDRTPRVLLVAVACVVTVVLLTALVAGFTQGSEAALGALVGGGIACAFFAFGSAVVNTATRLAPQAAIVVAMMTYAFQVALVLIAFIALDRSGLIGDVLSPGWVAGGVIAATIAWTVGQLVASARERVPAYDIELPGPAPTPGTDASRASVPRREVGDS